MRNTTTNPRSPKGRNSSAPLPGDEDGDEIQEAPGGEWDDVLPPDGEIRVALSEITQPGNAREFIGSFDRQQIGEDLAAFIGTNYGGGTYAWKLRSAKNKWLTSREVGGRPVSGTMKISERSYPRKTVAAAAAAAADAGGGSMTMAQMFQMMQDREARAFDLFMKAAEIRATPPAVAPGLGIMDVLTMMKAFRELTPVAVPGGGLGDTLQTLAALRQAFPEIGGGGGGGDDDEDGEGGGGIGQLIGIVKGVLQSQAAPVYDKTAAAPAVAENPGAAAAPVAKKEGGMFEAKVMHALKVLPGMAIEGLPAADAVDKLLYTWSAQDLDALTQNIDKLTADKVRPYLPDFEKHEVWYRAFFDALKAETVRDAEE